MQQDDESHWFALASTALLNGRNIETKVAAYEAAIDALFLLNMRESLGVMALVNQLTFRHREERLVPAVRVLPEPRRIALGRALVEAGRLDVPRSPRVFVRLLQLLAELQVSPEQVGLAPLDLTGAHLKRLEVAGVVLTDLRLRGADLSHVSLRDATITRCDLGGADLSNSNMRGAVIVETDLQGVRLTGADLTGATLRGCHLGGTVFTEAQRAQVGRIEEG